MTADERKRTALPRDRTFSVEDATPHFRISCTHLSNCSAVRTVALRGLIRTNANVVHFFFKVALLSSQITRCYVHAIRQVCSGNAKRVLWPLQRNRLGAETVEQSLPTCGRRGHYLLPSVT